MRKSYALSLLVYTFILRYATTLFPSKDIPAYFKHFSVHLSNKANEKENIKRNWSDKTDNTLREAYKITAYFVAVEYKMLEL